MFVFSVPLQVLVIARCSISALGFFFPSLLLPGEKHLLVFNLKQLCFALYPTCRSQVLQSSSSLVGISKSRDDRRINVP